MVSDSFRHPVRTHGVRALAELAAGHASPGGGEGGVPLSQKRLPLGRGYHIAMIMTGEIYIFSRFGKTHKTHTHT